MLVTEPADNTKEEDGKVNPAESQVDELTEQLVVSPSRSPIRLPHIPSFSEFVNRRKMKHNTSLDNSCEAFDDKKPAKIMKLQ